MADRASSAAADVSRADAEVRPPSLLLASNSPRRRELLGLGSWSLSSLASDVDETRVPGETPAEYVLRLAASKARVAAARDGSQSCIVAADTAVVDGDTLLGKPADAAEAVRMLRQLRGHAHQVYTGLAVFDPQSGELLTDLCITDVPMRAYSEAEIQDYVNSGDPFDKAGAYAIQNPGFRPVGNLSGCFASVMGMPLCHLMRLLQRAGRSAEADLPARCQAHLNYACPVSSAILRGEQVG
jgi:septum formation protein